jgi:hypothetical protein
VFFEFENATKDAAAHFARGVAQVDVHVVEARLDERVRSAAQTALDRAIRPFDDLAGQRFASSEHQRRDRLPGRRRRAPPERCNHFIFSASIC